MGNHLFVSFAVLDVSLAVKQCLSYSFLHSSFRHPCKPRLRAYVANKLLHNCVTIRWGLVCGANLWFGGFPYPVNPGRPEWSKVQTRGKPLVATAQATRVSAGE